MYEITQKAAEYLTLLPAGGKFIYHPGESSVGGGLHEPPQPAVAPTIIVIAPDQSEVILAELHEPVYVVDVDKCPGLDCPGIERDEDGYALGCAKHDEHDDGQRELGNIEAVGRVFAAAPAVTQALAVMCLDSRIRGFLLANDPMALQQAEDALRGIAFPEGVA